MHGRKFFINRKTMKRSFASLARGLRNTRLNSFSFRSCQTTGIWFYGHRKTVKWGVCRGGSQRRIRFVCRYVERNPLRANLVTKAEEWRYGSLYRWNQPTEPLPRILSPWPIPRLPNWNQHVNEPISEKELSALRTCVNRGRPYGDDRWTEKMADKHGVWATLRPVGRPRKKKQTPVT